MSRTHLPSTAALVLLLLAACGHYCPDPPGGGDWPRRISAGGVDYGTCDPCGVMAAVYLIPEPCVLAGAWIDEREPYGTSRRPERPF